MAKRYLTLLAAAVAMAACGSHNDGDVAPAAEARLWQTVCLGKLSPALELETSQLTASLPRTDGVDWRISITLEDRKAEIEFVPLSQPGLRGGGGKYEFDCETGVLTLVEPYR